MTFTDEQRLATAIHEAAHAVIGTLFGAEVRRAEVLLGGPRTNPDGMHGYCQYQPYQFEAEVSLPAITAAGTIAEAVFHHGPAPTFHQIDALLTKNSGDRDDLRRMCLAVGEPVTVPTDVLPLVLRCWEPICTLALQLRDGEIGRRDVLAALGIPSQDVTAHYAAMIRSGSAPGTFSAAPVAV